MRHHGWIGFLTCLAVFPSATLHAQAHERAPAPSWRAAGWGGGGYYWAAAFDSTKDGVIYMTGDVDGVYKTEDHGQHWRLINNGLTGYSVYSIAVDPHGQTLFVGTTDGLCKSTDGGEHWNSLPRTGPKELHLTGERDRESGNIAIDPANANVVYVGSPDGGVFKSEDGGQTWNEVYKPAQEAEVADVLRLHVGKINGQAFAGFWLPLVPPTSITNQDCQGFHLSFRVDGGVQPTLAMIQLTTKEGFHYRSRNLVGLFGKEGWQEVLLKGDDFAVDPDFAKSHPDQARQAPATPDWPSVNRLDFGCVNGLDANSATLRFKDFYFVVASQPSHRLVAKDFAKDRMVAVYGNASTGAAGAGSVRSIAIAAKAPNLVLAATEKDGIQLSSDAGRSWRQVNAPRGATSVAVAASDPKIIFGSFGSDGIYKSIDQGQTWDKCSQGINAACSVVRVVIAPDNAESVYAIGSQGWNGFFYRSSNGGTSWSESRSFNADFAASPVDDAKGPASAPLSSLTDITINPLHPAELFMSANWHPVHSDDGGRKLVEADRGADISCIYDVRFHNGRAYACAMDEGTFVSDDDGRKWRSLWPGKYAPAISGHNWRLAVSDGPSPGVDRIVATVTPWEDRQPNRVVVSDDGGKSYAVINNGLPNYLPTANTQWGQGCARAMAADPKDPSVLYLGIDGDPSSDHAGGGIFRSENGGRSWKQLEHQPGSRRMFFGLAVDPTDSNRLFWACCGSGGGLWRSEDAGNSWRHVFQNEQWLFNVMVTDDGTVYCPGKNLWRSTDHGNTWKQITHFKENWQLIGLAADPSNTSE
jgi:photosystem II stability/assembly factor-like uncharacterized protein